MNSFNLFEETMKVASELYEKNGREEGRDIENWLEAERIVQTAMDINNDNSNNNNSHDETMKVASELYEKNDREEGRDIGNWLEAERIVQTAMDINNDNSNNNNSHEETVKIASKLFDKSGRQEGRDFENWLEAERIVKAKKEFCEMFMQMLVQNPLGASKLMEAIKLLIDFKQKQQLGKTDSHIVIQGNSFSE